MLLVAGWAYQVTVVGQMLWYLHAVRGGRELGFGYAQLGAVMCIGAASFTVLALRRMALVMLAVFVVILLLLQSLMRGYAGVPGHLPGISYVDLARVLAGMIGLWIFNEQMV